MPKKTKKPDWSKIKLKYVTGDIGYRELAENVLYGLSTRGLGTVTYPTSAISRIIEACLYLF